MILTESVIQRIQEYIKQDSDECIEYPILNHNGYGEMQTNLNGKKQHYLMHRVAYQVFYNDDLTPQDIICHKCDNPKCVNPKHLFKGTPNDNVQDMVKKGRQAKGIRNGRYIDGRTLKAKSQIPMPRKRKLSRDQVFLVRKLRPYHTLTQVSEITNIPLSTVKDICCGRVYKDFISQIQ